MPISRQSHPTQPARLPGSFVGQAPVSFTEYPPRIARYRLIDMAGGEIGIINDDRASIVENELVTIPDGVEVPVVEIYDDEYGREGDVVATLVVDDGSV